MSVVFCKALWLGGGIRVETMQIIEQAIRGAEAMYTFQLDNDPMVRTELLNVANAAAAELTKVAHVPSWEDLL